MWLIFALFLAILCTSTCGYPTHSRYTATLEFELPCRLLLWCAFALPIRGLIGDEENSGLSDPFLILIEVTRVAVPCSDGSHT